MNNKNIKVGKQYSPSFPKFHGCNIVGMINIMKREQREHAYGLLSETYLKYRKVVAEWMIDVSSYFNLHPTTTHAAIAYLDRLQPNEKFSRFEWQMLAICCVVIASKYNECEEHVPDIATLEDISQQTISKETMLNYELWALKRMGWKLNARTPIVFLCSFIELGLIFPSDILPNKHLLSTRDFVVSFHKELHDVATMCLLDGSFSKYRASDVSCAIVYAVRRQLNIQPIWSSELTSVTSCDPTSLEVCEVLISLERIYTPIISNSFMFPPDPPNNKINKTQDNMSSYEKSLYVDTNNRTPDMKSNKENMSKKKDSNLVSPDSIAFNNLNIY